MKSDLLSSVAQFYWPLTVNAMTEENWFPLAEILAKRAAMATLIRYVT